MKLKKILIIFFLFDMVVFAGFGYYFYNKPHKDISGTQPEIIVSDEEIFKAFESNEAEAIKKFVTGDPVVQVAGNIEEIIKNTDSSITVILKNKTKYNGDISCAMNKSETAKLQNTKQGSFIKIKGQCSGMQELIDKEVVFFRCVVTE